MPTIDYPADVGIANYFAHDVQCSIMVGIDEFTCRRTEESSLRSSSKVFLMLADWFKSQRITFAGITFFMLHEVNTNHFALVAEIGG